MLISSMQVSPGSIGINTDRRCEIMKRKNSQGIRLIASLLLVSALLIMTTSCQGEEKTVDIVLTTSQESIEVGEGFVVTITIYPHSTEIGGWGFDLLFTPGLISVDSIAPGSNWTTFFDDGTINNDTGTISGMQTWSMGPYPLENHTACTIACSAIASGTCTISLRNIEIIDALAVSLNSTSNTLTVSIGGDEEDSQDGGGGGGSSPSKPSNDNDDQNPDDSETDDESSNESDVSPDSPVDDEQNQTGDTDDQSNDDTLGEEENDDDLLVTQATGTTGPLTPEHSIIIVVALAVVVIFFLVLYRRRRQK